MKEITPHLFQIAIGAVNTFVIEDDGLTLIDTGYPDSADKIFTAIKKGGKDPENIRRIILTHCHTDHAGSAAEIKRRLSIPVLAHDADATLIEKGISGRAPMHRASGLINWLVFNIFIRRAATTIQPVPIDQRIADGDVLPIAGGLQVVHTPGHSAGHIALLLQNDGVLIAGDICANAAGLALSTVNEDPQLAVKSIQKAAALDFSKAVFGHGSLLQHEANKKMRQKFAAGSTINQ